MVVARLDHRDLEAAVRQAEARNAEAQALAADARRVLEREQSIFGAGASYQAALDEATTALAVAEARVKTASAELESARAQLAYATIRVDAVPGVDYHGRLRQIVPTADRQKAVVQVKVTIEDRDERLVPDMSCSVTFVEMERPAETAQEAKPIIVVPQSALLTVGTATFVFEVQDGRLTRMPVVVGESRESDVVIESGLRGGETIVSDGVSGLEDGQRVRLQA